MSIPDTTPRIDYPQAVAHLAATGYPQPPERIHIRIPDAERHLRDGLGFFTHGRAVWSEANYRPVVQWLTDNEGRGLLLAGGCGLGKSLIGMRILPVIIHAACRKIVSVYRAQDLNTRPDEVLSRHLVYVDDVGSESMANIYGNRRMPFSELCDLAEQSGKLLIVSTNCDVPHLAQKYGDRTVDRLRAITRYVPFNGPSLRQ